MKNLLFISLILLLGSSCNSNKEKDQNIQTIHPKDIKVGEIIHDSLNHKQIEEIKKIQSAFAEVYPMSLEETITNFKRDLDVDSEINIWLNMVNAYEKYLNKKEGNLDLNTKKEVFKLILSRSMMSSSEAITNSKLVILTQKDAQEVLSFYTENPDPIDIIKK